MDTAMKEIDCLLFENSNKLSKQEIYDQCKSIYEKLSEEKSKELLWRMGKAAYMLSVWFERIGDKEKAKLYLQEAEDHLQKAIEFDKNQPDAHILYCYVLAKFCLISTNLREKLSKGLKFNEHLKISLSLKNDLASSYHLHGCYVHQMAKLNWFEKKFLSFVDTLPQPLTTESALKYLFDSNELRPNWKRNYTAIGKIYLDLKDYTNAMKWIDGGIKLPVISDEDAIDQEELTAIKKLVKV